MKTAFLSAFLALAVSQATAQLNITSDPFALVIQSDNTTINGHVLTSCHEGAAIEGLCLGALYDEASVQSFYLNTSYYSSLGPDDSDNPGYLIYELITGSVNVSEPMILTYSPSADYAVPLFYPESTGQEVAFDTDDLMYISGYDDTTVDFGDYEPLYRWYICETEAGYVYNTLAWGLGEAAPENPTCVAAQIERVFV